MSSVRNKSLFFIVALVVFAVIVGACAPAPTPAPTAAPPTAAPAQPTSVPPTAVPPTAAPAAATQPPATTAAVPTGELIIGLGNVPASGDPHRFTAPPSAYLNWLVFDSLLENDDKYQAQPALAESYKNINPTTWEFKLRAGVKFQNGDPLTSADVKFSFDRVLGSGNKLGQQARVLTISKVEAVDDTTVRITTEKPDPLFLQRIVSQFIIPQKYFTTQTEDGFGKAPIGTGPFKVTEITPDKQVVFAANPTSWRGAPKVAKMTWLVMRDPSARANALKTGEIDIAAAPPPEQLAALKSAGMQVLAVPRAQVQTVALEAKLKDSPLGKKEVRQALNYAVDKKAIVDSLLPGLGAIADGQLVGPDGFGYNPNLKAYPYDPKKAKDLLTAAGYPNGFSISMEATVGNFPNDKQVYEAVVQYLKDAGVNVDFKVIELSVWLKNLYGPVRAPLFVQGLQYLPFMDADIPLAWYSCTQPEDTKRFCNDAFESKFAASRVEMDPQKRKQLLQDANAVLNDEAPALFLYQLTDVWVLSSKVSGLASRSDAVLTLDRMTKK